MDNEVFEKFLQGTANDNQQGLCEDLLANSQTVVQQCKSTVADDSLLNALRLDQSGTNVDAAGVRMLVERIEQLVPREAIGKNELSQFLDPPLESDDLGCIGKYRIIELVATGGSGLVFRAMDPELRRVVCIKLLKPSSQFNGESKKRFERESREAARLVNDRIVAVIDAGHQNGLPWFAMPMLEGMTLRSRIQRMGTLEPEVALHHARQIAQGLEYAHGRSLIHRDIKPDNLWVTENDDIKILDFGLARLTDEQSPITRDGTVIGTPSYMAPEQVKGTGCDERSDLFSVGVVMVEMLTGTSPFQRENLFSTLMSIAGEQLDISQLDPEHKIPAGVRELIHDLLQIDPDRRVESATELIHRIDFLLKNPEKTQKRVVRSGGVGSGAWKWVAGGLIGAAICLAAFAIWAANDKGTLVVETADPDVKVQIANEVVTVVDPVTDRTYKIRIGATPLPTGVYQLETTDSSGDLVFSSETITIRRGEKVLVQVTLRKPDSPAVPNASTVLSVDPKNPSDEESATALERAADALLTTEGWADKSFDPVARKNFSETLMALPAIPIYEDNRSTDGIHSPPFAANSIVRKPTRLEGIESWSIELDDDLTALRRGSNNCDGSMSVIVDNLVRIYDHAGKLKYILPVRGIPKKANFDTKHPNLIGVSSFDSGDIPNLVGPTTKLRHVISIWRLGEQHAELLYRIPSGGRGFAWDNGYRLMHFHENAMVAFRLDNGSSFEIEKSAEGRFLAPNAFCPMGRYVVTHSNGGINIWDLQKCKFAFSIPMSNRFQWRSDSSEIAIQEDKRYVIWQTARPVIEKRVLLPETSESSSVATIVARALDLNFQHVAFLKGGGRLVVRNLSNNREGVASVVMKSGARNRPTLKWNVDGTLSITCPTVGEYRWRPASSDVHGEIELAYRFTESVDASQTGTKNQLVFDAVNGFEDGQAIVKWMFDRQSVARTGFKKRTSNVRHDYVARLNLTKGPALASLEGVPAGQNPFYSPDGTRMLLWNDIRYEQIDFGRRVAEAAALTLESVDGSMEPVELWSGSSSWNMQSKRWTRDSRYVLVCGNSGRNYTCTVFDRTGQKIIDLTKVGPHESFTKLVADSAWGPDKLLVTLESRSPKKGTTPVRSRELVTTQVRYIVDPANETVVPTEMFDNFEDIGVFSFVDDQVIFSGRKKGESADSEALTPGTDILTRRWENVYKATISDGKLTDITSFVTREFDQIQFSNDSKYVLVNSMDGVDNVRLFRGRRSITRSHDDNTTISISNWSDSAETPVYTGTFGPYLRSTWHRNKNTAAWTDRNSFYVYDVDSNSLRKRFFRRDVMFAATDSGWLIADNNRLISLDPQGELSGQLLFDPYLDANDQPVNGRWIMADGAMLDDTSKDGLVIAYCKDNRAYCVSLNDFVSDSDQPALPVLQPVDGSR